MLRPDSTTSQPSTIHAGSGPRGGFTLVELLVVLSIISILAFVALPRLLGGREKALTAACLANYHRLDSDLTNQMSTLESEGNPQAAELAIARVVAQAELEGVPNPRNRSEPSHVDGGTGPVVPDSTTSCQVFFYDATVSEATESPTVVVTQFEFEARSFRISLN